MKPKRNLRPFLLAAASSSLLAISSASAQTNGSWTFNNTGTANWSTATNWDSSQIADGAGATANFINNITADRTVTINTTRTIGILNVGDNNGVSSGNRFLFSGSALTFDNGSNAAEINEVGPVGAAGNTNPDQINAPVVLASNLIITTGGRLNFTTGGISETGGAKSITKKGTGVLSLGVASTYTGQTLIEAGQVNIGNNNALGTTAGNTVVSAGGTAYITSNAVTSVAENIEINGIGSDSTNANGSIAATPFKQGALRFGGGATTDWSGSITLGSDSRIRSDGGVTTTLSGGISLGSNQLELVLGGNSLTISTAITGTGGSMLINAVTTNTNPINFNAVNTYTGGTTINQGTVNVGASGALSGSTATLAVNNNNTTAAGNAVTLNLTTGADTTVGSLKGTIATPTSGTNTATINTQAGRTFTVNQTTNGTYEGVIAGDGGFTLGSSSTHQLTLSGTNTYNGATTVEAGTLIINGSTAAASAVSVASGATLGGSGTVGGTLNVSGIIAPGNSIGMLNAGTTTWNGAATAGSATDWKFELGAANTSDLLQITGDFNKDTTIGSIFRFDFLGSTDEGTFTLATWTGVSNFSVSDFDFTGYSGVNPGSFILNSNSLQFSAIPEPSTALGGLLLVAGLLRRKRRG
jgi:autotransporter-associated beta strand protein